MANYSAIKAAVNAYIKQNGKKEITGRILNSVLNATIDSLGRYFQFAGGAMPTDDPGTPDQNVCYLAGEPGVYTNFGGITIENEEVALLFWNGEWTKQRILIGIQEVEVSVDNQVGTPSVDVSYSGGQLVLTFHNLKGETGDAAGFGTIGADINGGVGTPGVSVESSGDNTAKNLMFHFTNLKGETGVTSVVATIDDTSGTPSCQVSLVNGVLTLAFSGLKGIKGDTGVSADYPITLYNGLDSDATDQALAAAQGVVLDGKISQLRQEVDGLAPLTEYVGRLESTSAKISNVSTYRYMVVPVKSSDVVKLTSNDCFYYVVSEFTFNPTLPYNLVLATGETSKHVATGGNTNTSIMPADAAYIILRGTISRLTINDRDILKGLSGFIKETNGRVDRLTERVDYVDIGVSQKFDGIIGNQFLGDLKTDKTIRTDANKKYVVISVNGGQVFRCRRTDNPATMFYVVSEFTLNPTLPYDLVLATGETTYHPLDIANYEYSFTLPNDAKYILMLSEASGVNYLPEYLALDGENLLNTYTENLGLTKEVDASTIREEEGFYRSESPYRYNAVEGYYATPLIPVYPGDIIETNTTINTPYNTAGHLCFDGDCAFVQVLQMVGGKTEITQAMVDAGVRFVGISFVKADTPNPSVVIIRQNVAELSTQVSDTQKKAQENETAISTINNKCRILVKRDGAFSFWVEVYNKKGDLVRYSFIHYVKTWDSLEYVDGEGHTQTKTNFTSADMWGNYAIYKNSTWLIQGNTNFICQVYGDTRHIGDAHGNEVLKACKFFADGVEFDPIALSSELECHELRWEWKSEVYSPNLSGTNSYAGAYPRFDTNGNPIVNYTHYMMGTLNDANEMKLDNRLCIKRDGLKFNAAFGAMLECNYGDFSQVSVATKESTINSVASDGTATAVFSDIVLSDYPNQLANKAVMMGTDFVVEQSIDIENGTPNVHCEFYDNRLKIYFMPVKGDTYKAEAWQADEFNTGDQIRVLTYRKIDI